jgi:membrane protease YdiL (CAAX protease family)
MLNIRIIRWKLKLAYAFAAIVVIFAIGALLRALDVAAIAVLLLGTLLDFAALFFGARVFRGRGEAIEPRRPWWRMTARPTLSRRLGILFLVVAVYALVSLVLTASGVAALRPTADDGASVSLQVLGVLENGGIAFLYLNSAARLKRLGVPAKEAKEPKEPKFRPTIRLKS